MLVQTNTKLTPEQLQGYIEILEAEESFIAQYPELKEEIKRRPIEAQEPFLTRKQVASLLQISLPTLHLYTKQGLLISYRIGTKVRYKAVEINNALQRRNFSLSFNGGKHGA